MPTIRGFVEALEIGRAGQATAFVLHGDGSRADYSIADLDADPERFNERLSQLGLLRDAMDRAEPVELEHDGKGITRVRRLSRDMLERPVETARTSGQVVGLALRVEQVPQQPEMTDSATLALMVGGNVERYVIALQTPERGTADAMVEMAQAAQAAGARLTIDYEQKNRRVVAMEMDGGFEERPAEDAIEFDGFVEAVGRRPGLDLMRVAMTTAPAFVGEGKVVPLLPFTPALFHLLVLRGSPEYALFEAALRDGLRMRVQANAYGAEQEEPNTPRPPSVAMMATAAPPPAAAATAIPQEALVRGATLLAPLCSASRPVWIQVNRQALDVGPASECVEGLPTSDLSPRTMRAIDLPYRAEWLGTGCFNHGVYRFQLELDVDFSIFVDGEPLCVHDDPESGARFAHACLDGEHMVQVLLEGWTCKAKFGMDVYRIR